MIKIRRARMSENWGKCESCGFIGFLQSKAVIKSAYLDTITGDTPDSVPVLNLCLTCFDTPAGFQSANIEHERLPAEEYLRK